MSWYRIEGRMPLHVKYAPLSDAAFRLSITAGAWCSENLSDGYIPKKMVPALTAAPRGKALQKAVDALVAANIWEDRGDRWFLHDFLDWNMSREQWEKKVAAAAAGGAAKAAKRAPTGTPPPLPHGTQHGSHNGTPNAKPHGLPDALPDLRSPISDPDLAKAAAASQRPDRLSREPERLQLRRESDSKPIPQPAQPAPQPPSGPRPPASGAPRLIPTPERQPEAVADTSQNCHSSDSEEQPRPPTRRERATSDLASLPIAELARRCRENPHDAGYASPQDRPEVRQVHEAWCRSVGLAVRPLGYLTDRNRPLRAILEALESNPLADVLRACEQASRDPWCRGEVTGRNGEPGRKHGIEDLTPTVLRRLLDAADERKPEIRSPRVQKAMDAVAAVLAGQR